MTLLWWMLAGAGVGLTLLAGYLWIAHRMDV